MRQPHRPAVAKQAVKATCDEPGVLGALLRIERLLQRIVAATEAAASPVVPDSPRSAPPDLQAPAREGQRTWTNPSDALDQNCGYFTSSFDRPLDVRSPDGGRCE